MPRWNCWTLLTLSAWALSSGMTRAQTIPPKEIPSKIPWVYSYEEGKKLGQKTKKPLFVVFRCER